MTWGVIFSTTSSDPRFSSSCSTLEAPRMTVLTLGFLRHHAIARRGRLVPRPFAMAAILGTAARFFSTPGFFRMASRSHSMPGVSSRELLGTPLLYLPVRRPEERGDQMVVPSPGPRYSAEYSFSTRA